MSDEMIKNKTWQHEETGRITTCAIRPGNRWHEVVWQRERLINLLPKARRKQLFAAISKLVEDYFVACQVDRCEVDTRWKIKYLVLSESHQRYKYNAEMALRRALKIHESVPVLFDEHD